MGLNYEVQKIRWDDVEILAQNIIKKINMMHIHIDTLVPIVRGGMPLALIIASNLDVQNTSCIHLRSSKTNQVNSAFEDPQILGITNEEEIKNKNILLIEDIVDSGRTLDQAIFVLQRYHPRNIYIASLYNFNKGKYKDRVISGKYSQNAYWVVFPWEIRYERKN